jgi:hypothetical protein
LPPHHAFQSGDLCFVFLQEIGCADVVLEGASFVLRDPDADKITGQVVALRQRMQGSPPTYSWAT